MLTTWIFQGACDDFEANLDEIVELGDRLGDLGSLLHTLLAQSHVHAAHGRLPEARERMRRMVDYCTEASFPWAPIGLTFAGRIELWLGDAESVRRTFAEAMETRIRDCTWSETEPAYRLASLAWLGDADAPGPASLLPSAPVVGRLNTTGSWACAAAIVEASLLRGEPELAATQYEALCQMRAAGNRVLWFFGLVEGLCAMSAAAGGRWEAAEGHFAAALAQSERLPFAPGRPETLHWHGRLLLEQGLDVERARAMLRDARDDYARIGMPLHVRAVEERLSS